MKKIVALIVCSYFLFSATFAQNAADRAFIIRNTNIIRLQELSEKFSNAQLTQKSAKKFKQKITNRKGETGYFSGVDKNGNPVYDFDENSNAAATSRANQIWEGGIAGLKLDGSGIEIGQWEASGLPRSSHVELRGKITDAENELHSSHATHTACTMVGTGVNSDAHGMAPGAKILAFNANGDESEIAEFAAAGGILSNHSYGTGDPDGEDSEYGIYTDNSAEWDEILYYAPYLTICKSAGNDRNNKVNTDDKGYDILYTVTVSKNLLTIGAVDDVTDYTGPQSVEQSKFSSWGPTDDWRIKPDLVANGVDVFSADNTGSSDYKSTSGSSMAAASATGTIALLQQHYHNLNSVFMKSATVKALVLGTTDEAGRFDGPDFQNGWGLLNAKRAAEVISNNGSLSLIEELTLTNGSTYSTEFEADGNNPIKIAIAWTDPAGTPVNGTDALWPMLVNDLDIRLTGNGETYKPWTMVPDLERTSFSDAAQKGDNFRDNIEIIEVKNIPAGNYTVTVSHKKKLKNNTQDFSLIINGIAGNPVSAEELVRTGKILLYPNPVNNGVLTIKITGKSVATKREVQLYNSVGVLVKKSSFSGNRFELNVSELKAGFYFLRIKSDSAVETQQIVIE